MTDEAYDDLKAALTWGATLDLSTDQRLSLPDLCSKIGTLTEGQFTGPGVPSWRLKEEAEKRRRAEARVASLSWRRRPTGAGDSTSVRIITRKRECRT